jgi:hypothetical protein
MPRFAQSALFGLVIVVGATIGAHAQSVSSLPPTGAPATPQNAVTTPYGSSQSYFPKPGGSETLKQQPAAQAAVPTPDDPSFAPYSAKGFGPKPN